MSGYKIMCKWGLLENVVNGGREWSSTALGSEGLGLGSCSCARSWGHTGSVTWPGALRCPSREGHTTRCLRDLGWSYQLSRCCSKGTIEIWICLCKEEGFMSMYRSVMCKYKKITLLWGGLDNFTYGPRHVWWSQRPLLDLRALCDFDSVLQLLTRLLLGAVH